MLKNRIDNALLLLALSITTGGWLKGQAADSPAEKHVFFRVQLSPSAPAPVSGRLLIFLKRGRGDKEINVDEFRPEGTWVAAQELADLEPGRSVEVDADESAFPQPFSALSPGGYEVQAILDIDHTYNYSGLGPQDWISRVIPLTNWSPATAAPPLTLDHHPGNRQPADRITKAMARIRADAARKEVFVSPSLSRFWGHPVAIKAWVILPPSYTEQGHERYPTVYWTHGFGGNLDSCLTQGMELRERMLQRKMPPMIWVMLDQSLPEGTHEFADSVNNGPWGTALIREFIPYLEQEYRMDARRDGRFLTGHSSGGWATLQLQINYPKTFGGTWSTSPDPSDFHDFVGPDLYRAGANVYRKPDGAPWPIIRDGRKVLSTLEQFSKLETVLGPYGGQMSSFDWVFSPKGDSGAPEPMFDRKTGAVNQKVVAYWGEHYDLAHLVEANWAARGPDLTGRIHVFVGTADTFYLDGAAHLFEAVLNRLGAQAQFYFLPNRTHFDLYTVGDDKDGLFDRISAEMYAIARPEARPEEEWKTK